MHTAVAGIGADGLTTDEYHNVPTTSVFDEQSGSISPPVANGPVPAVMGDRGTVTIPSEMRRHLRMQPGSPILIEERDGKVVIQPAAIVPLRSEDHATLEALLAEVTPENRHEETSTGAAVGAESW